MVSNISNPFNTLDVIKDQTACVVFSNISPKENLSKVNLVCKIWNQAATHTAKTQFIEEKKRELSEKMGYFLQMTGNGLKAVDYFPILKILEKTIYEYSPLDIHKQLDALIVKKELSIRNCHILSFNGYEAFRAEMQFQINCLKQLVASWSHLVETDPQMVDLTAHNIAQTIELPDGLTFNQIKQHIEERIRLDQFTLNAAEQRKESLFGKPFTNFGHKTSDSSNASRTPWIPGGVCMFPIELFKLRVQGADHAWVGPRSNVTHYFPFQGILFEVDLIPDQDFLLTERAAIIPIETLVKLPPQYYYDLKLHGMPLK